MNRGLSVSGVVSVDVNISPIAAGYRNFGVALVLGDSDIIDIGERVRFYRTLDEVAEEFGTSTPEYNAATLYFSQLPRPNSLYIGRWARTDTKAVLHGGVLNPADLDMVSWNSITNGSMAITVGGVAKTLTGLNFSSDTNLNQVAARIQAGTTGIEVTWDATYDRFDIKSVATGPTSGVLTYASPTGSGTDISAKMQMTSTLANAPVNGQLAETALAATQACASMSAEWYAVSFAASTMPTDNALVDVSAYIEGTERSRMHIITSQASACLDPLNSTDIGSRLKAIRYMRSFVQYSKFNKYAALSAFARAATVDFEANNTTLTLKFKQEPGVQVEILTETQASILTDKHINVFVQYDNDTAILQEGVMSNGYFFDEVHNSDWFANALQVDVWNLLYQSQTKIPQTDPGIAMITTVCEATCERAVNNGMLAPGVWGGGPVGLLRPGMTLSRGYYVFAPLVATQPAALREQRIAPTIQICGKFAGAVHFVNIIVNLNR
jgi:hypothetical protein